jgi:membrane protein DedA with SNARE-associated domain
MASMLERFIEWLLTGLLHLGYPGIIALMAMESSVLPVPAELVMPPAGYWVAKGEMNAVAAVASGVLGSLLGALANYGLALWLGRGFVRRFGKYFLISEKSLERSERYFAAHGEISVLLGRMLPVVRHLISIPAGMARMSLPAFVSYTGLGALVWCSILTWIGYFLGRHEGVLRNSAVQHYVSRALLIVLPVLALLVGIYVLRQRRGAPASEGD